MMICSALWITKRSVVIGLTLVAAWAASASLAASRKGEIEINVVDEKTGEAVACRMHLTNSRGVARKPPKLPFLKDHFAFDGTVALTLREGSYRFQAECGPEYHTRVGHFTVERTGVDVKTISMKRFVDMSAEGWWSGDLYVHRRIADVELLMRADDLHVAQVMTWSNKKNDLAKTRDRHERLTTFDSNRHFQILAGRDERAGGGLSFFHLDQPLPALSASASVTPEYPSTTTLVVAARKQPDVWIDADTPTAWDFPVWAAHGLIDSVRLAHHRYGRESYVKSERGQRPRDKGLFGDADGLGRWTDYVYFQLLNCGLRIPPSAGSGSGDVSNPVGYNRVYVFCGTEFSYENWWQGLRAGRVVVTNGPLLRPIVEGQLPGHVFRGDAGKTLRLQPELKLATKDKIEYLEVVKDGAAVHAVQLADYVNRKGKLPMLEFDSSGWFLIRAVTNVGETYRFASSGPFYVEIGSQRRVSRAAAEFFRDWVVERAGRLNIADGDHREEVLDEHRQARDYWQGLVDRANVD